MDYVDYIYTHNNSDNDLQKAVLSVIIMSVMSIMAFIKDMNTGKHPNNIIHASLYSRRNNNTQIYGMATVLQTILVTIRNNVFSST